MLKVIPQSLVYIMSLNAQSHNTIPYYCRIQKFNVPIIIAMLKTIAFCIKLGVKILPKVHIVEFF